MLRNHRFIMAEETATRHAGQPAAYILAYGTVQEVNWYKHSGSWFAGDSVIEGVHPLTLQLLGPELCRRHRHAVGSQLRNIPAAAQRSVRMSVSPLVGPKCMHDAVPEARVLVRADGGLWLATPVDVLLVLFPLLEDGRRQARPQQSHSALVSQLQQPYT